jgi:glycosidase
MTPLPPTPRLRRLALLLVTLTTTALSQTLARPGWVGSGMNAEPWWKHAVIYQVDPTTFTTNELQGITTHLDYIQSLGADAILLTPLNTTPNAQTIDPAHGTVDDLDDLIHQSSRHNIRVLLTLPEANPTAARFWLNHGIAGFYLTGIVPTQAPELRKILSSYVGQRILINDVTQYDDSQLTITPIVDLHATQLSAQTTRPAIETTQSDPQSGHSAPLLITDGPGLTRSMSRFSDGKHDLAIAKAVAAILLTNRAAALIYYGQELGLTTPPTPESTAPQIHWEAPPAPAKGHAAPTPEPGEAGPNVALEDANSASLLNWYRQLSALHHGNATISTGAPIALNRDDQNVLVWVRKPKAISTISPAIVVICNLSAQPVQLSLKSDMQRLHLKGSFLRTVMRSDTGSGPMHLESMTISPYGVYIGELRY